ncbi:MAG: D-amino acid aminotransferase [Limnochordales bacterium]|nr:D-amino acid aminotransferase [Limnochordales bacterium]
MSEPEVFLNGEWMPHSRARVSVDDRGFVFADAIYDVLKAYRGFPFALERHLDRLERSAAAVRLRLPVGRAELKRLVLELLERNGLGRKADRDAMIYIHITRGVAPRNHLFPAGVEPTFYLYARELPPWPEWMFSEGVKVITLPDRRWELCHIKTTGLLYNVLARQQAYEAGAWEAVLVRDGKVTEGSHTNLFAVVDGVLRTHPTGPHILPGITRSVTLEVAAALGIPVEERALDLDELRRAEEVFLTGTTIEVLPVREVDGRPVGQGRPGVVTRRLRQAFLESVAFRKAHPSPAGC